MKINNKLSVYIKESISELKKINLPKKDEIINSTKVVLIIIFILSFTLGLFDYFIGLLTRILFR